jgi:predicted ATP-binding protein involved in virulence
MKLKSLQITNFRCFESLSIDFDEKLTVLVAPNGLGKTAILEAIAIAFGPYVGAFDEAVGKHFHPSDIRLIRARNTSSNEMEFASGGVSLEAKVDIPGSSSKLPTILKRSLAGKKNKSTIKDAKELIDYGKRMQNAIRESNTTEILPVITYYDTGRLWLTEKLTLAKLQRTSRSIGYTNCLDTGSKYKTFAEWFRYWNMSAMESRYDAMSIGVPYIPNEFDHYIESVGEAVNTCLAPSGWKNITYRASLQELVAWHDDYGELPISLLSDGIRNMIGMVADIAFRATKLNPTLKSVTKKTPGIVLIDEVDMHLHPSWQQLVLNSLTTTFPLIQFIVTTHSPHVISTVHRESIRVIGKGVDGHHNVAVMPLAESYGEISSDVLESIMHVNPQPPVAEKQKLERLTELVDQGLYPTPEAVNLLAELKTALSENHPQLQKLQRSIKRQELLNA